MRGSISQSFTALMKLVKKLQASRHVETEAVPSSLRLPVSVVRMPTLQITEPRELPKS